MLAHCLRSLSFVSVETDFMSCAFILSLFVHWPSCTGLGYLEKNLDVFHSNVCC